MLDLYRMQKYCEPEQKELIFQDLNIYGDQAHQWANDCRAIRVSEVKQQPIKKKEQNRCLFSHAKQTMTNL